MTVTLDEAAADPQQIISDLRRQLDKRTAELAASNAERDEALARESATAEILQIINSSSGDLAPVFDAILEKAHILCGAVQGAMYLCDGDHFYAVAQRGHDEPFAARLRQGFRGSETPTSQPLISGDRFVHIPDLGQLEHPIARAGVELAGTRTLLSVPLRKGDALLGMVVAARREARPFSEKEIALLENFAAQAAIAMENARLITETREALEQQTATAEVLGVINASPGNLAPIFDAMLEKATRLCEAAFGILNTYEDERFRTVALRGVPLALEQFLLQSQAPSPAPESPPGRIIGGESVIQVADLVVLEGNRDARGRAMVELGGARSYVTVALRKDGRLLGTIAAYRQEVRAFTDKQVALLQNFAAQAVIAMENARLLTETREALDQQTATAEVLGCINSSPGDLAPVFDTMLDKAIRLCEAEIGVLWSYDGELMHPTAIRSPSPEYAEFLRQGGPRRPAGNQRPLLQGERFVQIDDLSASEGYLQGDPIPRAAADLGGVRSLLNLALRKDDKVLGLFAIYRTEIRPFSDKQIALLQNFAAQAVIAMENARLITETREALEQQTATAEVLQVINSSPGDLTPVFDSMLDKAMQLCAAVYGGLWTWDGETFSAAALRGVPPEYAEFAAHHPRSAKPDTALGQLVAGADFAQVMDAQSRRTTDEVAQKLVELGGIRTLLGVPLRKQGVLLGVFVIYRQEVRAFTDKEIALLQNFAAQAVIAMQNARLITETREALDQQTATAEVLQVINSSTGDLAPVFDAMLEKTLDLCDASFGSLHTWDGECFLATATRGALPMQQNFLRAPRRPRSNEGLGRIVAGEDLVHIRDVRLTEAYISGDPKRREVVDTATIRTYIVIALRKEDRLLGAITAYRREVRPFSNKQIALLQNFAAQAVIAMDNARLLEEIRQRQAELRVTFDNMGDGVAMFDGEMRLTAWNRNFQQILELPDAFVAQRPTLSEYFQYMRERGEYGSTELEEQIRRGIEDTRHEARFERTRPDGRVIEVRRNAVPGGGSVLIFSATNGGAAQMRRRDFLNVFLGFACAEWSSATHAQHAGKVWRIGVLETVPSALNAANFNALRDALRNLGYLEGRNLAFEYRSADGKVDRFPVLATELVRAKVDLILTRGTPAVIAAKAATTTLPIVMAASGDPLASGVIAELARPGANVTGLSADTNELIGKRIELLNEVVPKIARIGFLQDMSNPIGPSQWKEAQAAARRFGLAPLLINVKASEDLAGGFETVRTQRLDALAVGNDTVTQANRRQIIDLTAHYRVPAIYATTEFAELGGLLAYAVDYADLYRRAAAYVDKIFRGAKPADLPVEQPARFKLIINLKTAKALGLTVPQALLARADEVIE